MLTIKDDNQGKDENGRDFGYCFLDGRGGYFFSYMDTLGETLASIHEDELEPVKTPWPKRARAEMRGFIRLCWKNRISTGA